jgi:hypothetical protein
MPSESAGTVSAARFSLCSKPVHCENVIRLRKEMERAARHPLFGPICLLLLALLMAFVVLHVTHDAAHADDAGELICVAFAIGVLFWRVVAPPLGGPLEYVIHERALPPPRVPCTPSCPADAFSHPVPLLL